MLNIYTGREDIDKQGFLFAKIKRRDLDAEHKQKIFLIVPDQFTLETERSAFSYMDVSAFINPVILSMNRLAGKVLAEAGERTDHMDRYGNYMLLSRLLYRKKGGLELYRDLENSTKFISQISEAINSLKSHMVSPEMLEECAKAAEREGAGSAMLGKKLRDMVAIYSDYEKALEEGIPDSADVTRRFVELIPGSQLLRGSCVWVFGFDYFSMLHLSALGAMAACADEVNVVLASEQGNSFFALTNDMIDALEKAAHETGAQSRVVSVEKDAAEHGINCRYLPGDEKPPEIVHVEKTVFAGPVSPYAGEGPEEPNQTVAENGESGPEKTKSGPALRFAVAQNYYSEAEAAAQTILRLVKDEGLRFRDILVVCNDQNRRASAIQRIFDAYGITTFLDKRHDAGYNPVLTYITALPEIISRGRRHEDVLRWIGTGLSGVSAEDAEELENYTLRYRLRGNAWRGRLKRGGSYDDETFGRIESTVKYIGETLDRFAECFGADGGKPSTQTAYARTEGMKKFLEESQLPEKIDYYAEGLEAEGFLEYAARMRGVWDVALGVFSQIGAVLGSVETSAEEYATILRVGFASVMIGVLPASSDCVTIGTMQRTRTSRVKAMFVLGANDGELPMFEEDDGLLDDSEKENLEGLGITAFRREVNLHHEEQLAIYKNLSKPTRLLYMSYTAFSADGKKDMKPSRVFERLRALFPDIPIEKDSEIILDARPSFKSMMRFETGEYKLGPERMRSLIPPVLSPTAIEKYSRCPFAFLMDRGLKLGEIREHMIDSRGIGDVYHETLRRFGNVMNQRGGDPKEENSAWNKAMRDETDKIVDKIFFDMKSDGFGISEEGALLFDDNDPAAVYRKRRLQSITKDICWALTEGARSSGTERMLFEVGFGAGKNLEMIQVNSESEEKLGIEGRIDRIDILPEGRAKVTDYKSGFEKFSSENVKKGWQLQLMLYLKAIEKNYEPFGVSYFRIFEPRIDISKEDAPATLEEINETILDQFRSDGITLEEGSNEKTLSPEEFNELRLAVDEKLAEIAVGLAEGSTPASPKQKAGGEVTACTWCDYLSICNFEAT